MRPRWLMRVTSHPRYGGGHVARSVPLAAALREAGAEPVVWLDPGSQEAAARFCEVGVAASEDRPAMSGWSGSLVDGYELVSEVRLLAREVPPLVVLDDHLAPPTGAALVINAAPHLYEAEVAGVSALLGPAYALIDPAFAALPERDRTAPVREAVVSFGKLDSPNATCAALRALAEVGGDFRTTVLAASASLHLPAIRCAVERLGPRGRLFLDAPSILPFIGEADLVVGAGGVSMLERLAAGIPSVTAVVAENQRRFVEGAAHLGATRAAAVDAAELTVAIRSLLASGPARAAMGAKARRLVDGRGPARVAKRMMELPAAHGRGGGGKRDDPRDSILNETKCRGLWKQR